MLPAKIKKTTNNQSKTSLERCVAVLAPTGEKIVATIKIGIAVLKTISFFLAKLMEAKIIAIEFRSKAVDIAVRSGIFKARKIGIRIKAAPTPAIVKIVVKTKVTIPAIIYTNIIHLLKFKVKNPPQAVCALPISIIFHISYPEQGIQTFLPSFTLNLFSATISPHISHLTALKEDLGTGGSL